MLFRKFFLFTLSLLILSACTTKQPSMENNQNLTVGTVQREIHVGMSSADVVSVLGSPNMVTTDAERRETWVYDKVSTTVQNSSSGAGVWLLLVGASSNSSERTSSQRTLTIIIKFDNNSLVRDFAYRTSSF